VDGPRLSALDTAFLDIEDAHCALHIGGVAIFDGPVPEPPEIAELYLGRIAREPRYRRRLDRGWAGVGPVRWVDDPAFDPEYHLRRTALPRPGGRVELDRLVGRVMSARLDDSRAPWEAWVVEGLAGSRWALLLKVHHSLADGLGGMALFGALLDGAAGSGPGVLDAPAGGPLRWVSPLRDGGRAVISGALSPRRTVGRAAAIATGSAKYLAALRPADRTSLTGPLGTPRRYRTASVPLADVLAARRGRPVTVNDVVLAAVSRGFRRLLLSRGEELTAHAVRSLVPVNSRSATTRPDGNAISAMLVDLPVDQADAGVALAAVASRTRRLKAAHQADAGRAAVALADRLPALGVSVVLRLLRRLPQRVVTTVVTNVPGPRDPVTLLGRRMVALYPYVPIAEGLRIGIAFTTYDGQLHLGVTCDRDAVRDADVLVDGIVDGVAELARPLPAPAVDPS
jgi:diacylglycerol O-acyltransferase